MTAALHEVPAERRAAVAQDLIHAARQRHEQEHRRAPALTAREGLVALHDAGMLVWVAAGNTRAGVALNDDDFGDLTRAMRDIDAIFREVIR